jgi:sulfopyruvate decarboxylase TPP-binding subunit
MLSSFFGRSFALRAQDRAIRAEENMRHFIMTGKALPSALRIRQIIGLRFASDEEFLELIKDAIENNLKEKQIKAKIKNWKADFYRV